jgi:hypothetical protein
LKSPGREWNRLTIESSTPSIRQGSTRQELGLLYNQRIVKYGHAPGARVKNILLGFRDRDKSRIREALKSISDQIPDPS